MVTSGKDNGGILFQRLDILWWIPFVILLLIIILQRGNYPFLTNKPNSSLWIASSWRRWWRSFSAQYNNSYINNTNIIITSIIKILLIGFLIFMAYQPLWDVWCQSHRRKTAVILFDPQLRRFIPFRTVLVRKWTE